jgi:hypothetical protein
MTVVWSEIVAAATVGTDRSGGTDAQATALLEEAAVASVRRRAGAHPVAGLDAPTPAGEETADLAVPAAAARLSVLLAAQDGARLDADTRAALLPEWLSAAATHRRRVPPELLPDLLEAGRRSRDLRPHILAAGGVRVRWLAAQRPEWAYLATTVDAQPVESTDERAWQEGTTGERHGYLAAARRADPAAARALLERDWAGIAGDERGKLIATLRTGLAPDDEALLERALDDKRKEVRTTAADLLAVLPGSAYQQRMSERTRACVTVGRKITVSPPAECDAGMLRDGVHAKPPTGTGERAWWLEELIARTPLKSWTTDDPAAFVKLKVADDWTWPLRRGLARAAVMQRDSAWAGALLDAFAARVRGGEHQEDRLLAEALLPVLGAAELAARATAAVRAFPEAVLGSYRQLELCPVPWPAELTAAVFAGIAATAIDAKQGYRVGEICRLAAVSAPVAAMGDAERIATGLASARPDSPNLDSVQRLADVLHFRHDMIQELR